MKMDDLISRAAANARIDKCVTLSGIGLEPVMAVRDIKALISVLPAVDAVPVVRCKDCKHWWQVNELCTHQRHVHGTVCAHECKAMDYCSDGERRDEDATD